MLSSFSQLSLWKCNETFHSYIHIYVCIYVCVICMYINIYIYGRGECCEINWPLRTCSYIQKWEVEKFDLCFFYWGKLLAVKFRLYLNWFDQEFSAHFSMFVRNVAFRSHLCLPDNAKWKREYLQKCGYCEETADRRFNYPRRTQRHLDLNAVSKQRSNNG